MSQDESTALQRAKEIILNNGIVAIPTETVYGLAASIYSEIALKRVFAIKERPFFDPLIVHIADLDQRKLVVREWPPIAQILAEKFWPGPLTMVLPKHEQITTLITSGLDTVGLRMPAHSYTRDLIRITQTPLAAPSANKFGKTSPTTASHVRKAFGKENVFVLDGGACEVGLESTVLSMDTSGKVVEISILRPGAITEEMIADELKRVGMDFVISRKNSNASPGHTEHHYMPSVPLVLVEHDDAGLSPETRRNIGRDLNLQNKIIGAELKLNSNPVLAARELYAGMRECAETGASFIYVIKRKNQSGGMWEAIWDRVGRAAAKKYGME